MLMISDIFTKIFGSKHERDYKKLKPVITEINAYYEEYKNLSEESLKAKTEEFRKRLSESETLDDILPEAFATVREASIRTLQMRHFDVQLIGGIVLHQGKIAEIGRASCRERV